MKLQDSSLLRTQCHINGDWLGPADKGDLSVRNPSTGEEITRVTTVDADGTRAAI